MHLLLRCRHAASVRASRRGPTSECRSIGLTGGFDARVRDWEPPPSALGNARRRADRRRARRADGPGVQLSLTPAPPAASWPPRRGPSGRSARLLPSPRPSRRGAAAGNPPPSRACRAGRGRSASDRGPRAARQLRIRRGGVHSMTVIAQPGADVRVRTLSSEDEFTELADVWDDLVLAMTRPSPFLLHTWLREWWRHYANDGQLAIHVAYRGDRLVGALPLSVRRRLGLRITEFIGGWALLADVLIARGEDESVVAGALAERASTMDHDFADLYGLTGASRLVAALPPDFRLIERLEAPILELSSGWEAVSQSKLSPKARSMRRPRRRQLEALGPVEVALAPP